MDESLDQHFHYFISTQYPFHTKETDPISGPHSKLNLGHFPVDIPDAILHPNIGAIKLVQRIPQLDTKGQSAAKCSIIVIYPVIMDWYNLPAKDAHHYRRSKVLQDSQFQLLCYIQQAKQDCATYIQSNISDVTLLTLTSVWCDSGGSFPDHKCLHTIKC